METDCLRGADRDGYDASLDASELHRWSSLAAAPVDGGGGAVTGYAGPGKAKARVVCQAFVDGAGGGRVYQPPTRSLAAGGAAFFGVTEATQHLWNQARRQGRDWFYLDNAYFDAARGRMLRATRNAVQASGREPPDWGRWAALDIRIQPWRRQGRHVLLIAQSQTHMQFVAGQRASWWRDALELLRRHTDREIVVRGWRSDKRALAATLAEALRDCWALVTWSSAAANEALVAGVPVFAAGPCAASPMALDDLTRIETPIYPEGRAVWGAALAGRQWTLDEMRSGLAWHTLHA
jgi:hypothetical protein